jgi:competence ComEA-like helix-hairpin-helix protein
MPVRTYFVFSKTERIGIIAIFIFILIVVILPRILFISKEKLQVRKDSILTYLGREEVLNSSEYMRAKDTNTKTFQKTDINLATYQELEHLPCIGTVMAKRIVSYREKVKKFNTVEELKKVYGLKDSCYQKILPYVFVVSKGEKQEEKHQKTIEKINLNTCDSVQLVQLRGVGEKTAQRVLQIRRKIKIFYDVRQLSCLGLNTDVVKNIENQCFIEPDAINHIQKISLNTIEEKKVFKSPGFTYELAKSFVQYRKKLKKQGKMIVSWNELITNVEGLDKEWLNCWQAYYEL